MKFLWFFTEKKRVTNQGINQGKFKIDWRVPQRGSPSTVGNADLEGQDAL